MSLLIQKKRIFNWYDNAFLKTDSKLHRNIKTGNLLAFIVDLAACSIKYKLDLTAY